MNTVAVVLASGRGERFGKSNIPKHLTPFLGVPCIIWTLDTILKSKLFSAVVVVVSKKNMAITKENLSKYFLDEKVSMITTEGANDRTQSFDLGFNCLKKLNFIDQSSILALFDANRPFVQVSQLLELHQAMDANACACPARPLVNGVAFVDTNYIVSVPKKSDLMEFVTPEFVNLHHFSCNLDKFLDGHNCLVELSLASGIQPYTIRATDINTKLTYPEDQPFMEELAKQKKLMPPIPHADLKKMSFSLRPNQ